MAKILSVYNRLLARDYENSNGAREGLIDLLSLSASIITTFINLLLRVGNMVDTIKHVPLSLCRWYCYAKAVSVWSVI